ncbi:MAG TPA: cysteine desulfurase, partial [Methanothrix sp.]|nr:cysteine desulfurase [Methanothrix sp.]
MNVQDIRSDFPILKNGVYLDSASTSLTPEPVLEAVLDYYRSYRANVGRGIYKLAQIADQRYSDAHHKLASFTGAEEGVLIFTRNTTEAINSVACGLDWKKGDGIVTTLLEHHSNLLPWMRLKKDGVELSIVKPGPQGRLDPEDFEKAIDENTRLVAVSHLSNVLGTVLPVKEIARICRDRGAALLVDGAQAVPHMPVSVKDIDCDFLCFSGHKMLGPTGTGCLWIRRPEEIEPLLVGGGMVADIHGCDFDVKKGYEGFEAGTPDIAGAFGLGAAVDYLTRVGIEEIHDREKRLTGKLLKGLGVIEGVEIYGPLDLKERGGVVSFNVRGSMPHEVAMMLDHASNIMVRSGHHCCIPLMRHLGLKYGTVRASLYLYNTEDEIDQLLAALEQIARMG